MRGPEEWPSSKEQSRGQNSAYRSGCLSLLWFGIGSARSRQTLVNTRRPVYIEGILECPLWCLNHRCSSIFSRLCWRSYWQRGVLRPYSVVAGGGATPPFPPRPGHDSGFLVLPGGLRLDPHCQEMAIAGESLDSLPLQTGYFRNISNRRRRRTIPSNAETRGFIRRGPSRALHL
jgi:hypothetical protein